MREAEEAAQNAEAPERTLGVYEKKEQKYGKITKKMWYIIDPRTSKFIGYWDLVGMSALIFTAIVTFVEVAFVTPSGQPDALFFINRIVDIIFTVDMILQFFLMYPAKPKSITDTVRWIHDQDRIAMNYAKSWFPLDLLSILVSGFDLISLDAVTGGGGGDTNQYRVLRLMRVARLVKLVRLVRSSRIMKRFESRTAVNYGYLALFKTLVILVIASHWYACIWGLITQFEDGNFQNTWYVVFGYCNFPKEGSAGEAAQFAASAQPLNATLAAVLKEEEGYEMNYQCVGPTKRYVAALYWAIMTITSIGYGDIRAPDVNTEEQAWCAFLMLFGGMIWGSVIATFCGVVATLDPSGTEFRTTMDNLNRFMQLQGLPTEMRQQLREYFHQTKHLQIARANRLLIESMSPMLQGKVVWKVNEKWLRHVWFLATAEDNFMVQLSLNLTAAVFAPAELCPNGYMYIVHRGIALYGGKVLTSGKVWGEDMILQSAHLRSKYAARCMTYVEVYMISRDQLVDVATRFPATFKLIKRSAFRLGFRREMIRRATRSINQKNAAAGTKSKNSVSERLLVAVSSRHLDEEQEKAEKAGLAKLDATFGGDGSGAEAEAYADPGAPSGGGGGGGGMDEAAVLRMLDAHSSKQMQAISALEDTMKKRHEELATALADIGKQLAAAGGGGGGA